MLLYYFIKTPFATLPVELLHGFSWSLFWVVCVEYVNKLVDERWQATGQSLLYAAYFGIGAIAGNYWVKFLLERKMKMPEVFLVNAGVVAAAFLLLLLFLKKKIPRCNYLFLPTYSEVFFISLYHTPFSNSPTHQSTKFTTWSSTGA
jgi:MFS transporter, PPP family, 3-phenylpropionic acid transporter